METAKLSMPSDINNLQPKYLWFLILTFCMVIVLANWFNPRLIVIFGLTTDAGTLIFPLTFLISDLITEVYGYKQARRAIWCGFLFNFVFIIFGQIVIHMPSPDYAIHNEMFNEILSINTRIIIASFISYLIAEPFNAYLLGQMKIKMQGKYIGIRFVGSTIVASGIDSFIFGIIAFYGIIENKYLISLILTMWFLKILIETLGLPLSIRMAKKLKQVEKMDMYDISTNFSLFKLDVKYQEKSNKYQD